MITERARRAIEAADTDELLRVVDGLCENRSWEGLVALRSHCRAAIERGKQLWGVDEHIRYRLALEAPASLAGPAVSEGPTRFTLGPLPEVAASTHSWEELAPHLSPGPQREMVAHERVVRREDLTHLETDDPVLELPFELLEWEPRYPLATYRADRVELPTPDRPETEPIALPPRPTSSPDPEVEEALASLVSPWVEQSNGRLEMASVEGDALEAVAAVGPSHATAATVEPRIALAWMGWAAASGGAHGRRRGAAAGRFGAWWAVTAILGLGWPPDPIRLGDELGELEWILWSDGTQTGWALHLAVCDPRRGRAWAMAAADARMTGE